MIKESLGLLINYLKIGFRSLHRYRPYSIINLLGLVIGLSSVFCIAAHLHGEYSFDRFHKNGDHVYRVNGIFIRTSGDIRYPLIPPAISPAILDNFPEVERVSRLRYAYSVLMKHKDQSFYEDKVFFAESDFLEMFSFKTIRGNAVEALKKLNTVVITESIAIKYFGNQDPLGQTINYNDEITLTIGSVIEDVPKNSHLSFDFLISFPTFEPGPGSLADLTSWRWLGFLTYIQLNEKTDVTQLEGKLAKLFKENNTSTTNKEVHIQLQALPDIYLKSSDLSNPMGGLFKINNSNNLLSLGIIAILIIIIAFFNYLNIVTALLRTRTREMGIRKVFGSSRLKIIGQLIIESWVVVSTAGLVSLLVLMFVHQLGFLPLVSQATIFSVLIIMSIICTLFGLLSGFYLGAVLSGYSTLALLQNNLSRKSTKFSFKYVVLFIQYCISAALIAISLIVIAQVKFFNQKELGYDKEGILVSPFRGENVHAKIKPLRNSLESNPLIHSVSFGPALDGSTSGHPLRLKEWPEDQVVQIAYLGIDYEFPSLLDLELVSGRFFSESIQSDSSQALMINETLAGKLGLDNPLNKKVIFLSGREYEIIGVFSDFHYQSLHHEIGPLALQISSGPPRNILIKFQGKNITEAISSIKKSWDTVFPGGAAPLQYRFLDNQVAQMYSKEKDFATRIQLFTGLAIFVALLGLFGLSAITIHLQIKQISIRRVLGAQLLDIFKDVGQNFLLIALTASILSWPLVLYLMKKWLENFAYSIDIDVSFLFQMLAIVLIITLITLAIQVRRVITTNPATILKNEK